MHSAETQKAVRTRSRDAKKALVFLGVNECEARELLDEQADCLGMRPAHHGVSAL